MAKELKDIIVTDFKERFGGLDGCVLIDYHGLDAEQTLDLRGSLRDSGIRMMVLHNRLAKRAFAEDESIPEDFAGLLAGPTAILYGEGGALSASKCFYNWQRKNRGVAALKGGLFDGKVLSVDDVVDLAKVPDRETLLAQTAGMFVSPSAVLASAVEGLVSHLASCVRSRQEELGPE